MNTDKQQIPPDNWDKSKAYVSPSGENAAFWNGNNWVHYVRHDVVQEYAAQPKNSIEQLGISTWVEPVILENNEIGYAAHFQIDNQTFYVNPRATEQTAKWYEQALITAFQKIKLHTSKNNERNKDQ